MLAAAADAVARARKLATDWDSESSQAWDFLELAANVETAANVLATLLAELPVAETVR
jgi:hypothetical protein